MLTCHACLLRSHYLPPVGLGFGLLEPYDFGRGLLDEIKVNHVSRSAFAFLAHGAHFVYVLRGVLEFKSHEGGGLFVVLAEEVLGGHWRQTARYFIQQGANSAMSTF